MSFAKRNTQSAPKQETKQESKSTSSGKPTYVNNALTIMKGKDGGSFIVFDSKTNVEIFVNGKKVTKFITKDPMVSLDEAVEAGRLTAEKAEEIAGKIQNVLGNVTLVLE